MKRFILAAALLLLPVLVLGATVPSSTLQLTGTLTDNGDGTYTGVVPMEVDSGFDIFAKEGDTAWFGDDPGSGPVWTSQAIGTDHDAWPSYDPDTPDWYAYSVSFYEDGGVQKWALRNHPGATVDHPWYDEAYWGVGGKPAMGVPMSGTMDWTTGYATETDTGAYLPGTGTAEIPGGAAGHGGGAGAWDMDWSWGSEAVPLQYAGFAVSVWYDGANYQVTMTPAPPLVVDPDWSAFIIRNNATDGPPLIYGNGAHAVSGAPEFAIFASGQKAGLGTDKINQARVSAITTLHIDRLDDVGSSGSLYGPYFNVWVTDGAGNFAVIANEPSNGEWGGDPWDVTGWNDLKTKTCKVYEVAGGNTGTSWVHNVALANGWDGVLADLTFEHVGNLVIEPPSPAYIAASADIGSGAPDELGTNIARGFNWIFGDTASNYVTGTGEGFVVDNYSATATYPVNNIDKGTGYATIAAAVADADAGNTITVAAGTYPENIVIPVGLTLRTTAGAIITGGGGATVTLNADNVEIDGFTITNPTGLQAVYANDHSNLYIHDNVITNVGDGVTAAGVQAIAVTCTAMDVDNIVIENNDINNILGGPNKTMSAIAIGWSTGDFLIRDLVIQNNILHQLHANTDPWPVGHGVYGILLNHGTGLTGMTVAPQILNNTIDDLEGLWAHAIGLEGNTPNALVSGNTISNLVDHKSPSDAVGVMVEDNAGLASVQIHGNAFAPNVAVGVFNWQYTGPDYVNALGNWWGDASGPQNPTSNPGGLGAYVGDYVLFDPWSGMGGFTVTPAATGPVMCGETHTLTVNLVTDGYTPDVFGFNTVVRVSSELSWGAITSLAPFGTTTQFLTFDNGDGSWTISGTTVGSPTQPISGAGTTGLFTIDFTTAAEGTGAVTFDSFSLRDPNNAPIPATATGATFTIDCTPPAPVTDITATPGYRKVNVAWSHTGADVDHYEVFSGLWHNGTVGTSAYPEYDDVHAYVPNRPGSYANADASTEWTGPYTAAGLAYTQQWTASDHRGVYTYEVFAVDAAGNVSAPAAANDRATNYWLGDVTGAPGVTTPNGLVDVYDMNDLGTAFGTTAAGGGTYNNVIDVGPTDDWSRLGIPLTDNRIDFEDLMVFSMNFGVVSAAKDKTPIPGSVDLAWVYNDDGTMALRLVDGSGLKGLRVTAAQPVRKVTAGLLLDDQLEPTFVRNVGTNLDASVAVMGLNVGFTGQGDLMIIAADDPIASGELKITARGIDNSALKVNLTQTTGTVTPRVFSLNANYPNPFNPMTKISFSLPEAQDVKLTVYGIDGKRVATLINGRMDAGLHEVIWEGRDDSGKSMATGTYFYQIKAGPYSQVRKMTLVK